MRRALIVAVLLTACTPQTKTWTVNDLLAAEADARAHNDTTALCWSGLRWYVQAQVIGAATAMQLVRDLFQDSAMQNACAPMALQILALRDATFTTLLLPHIP